MYLQNTSNALDYTVVFFVIWSVCVYGKKPLMMSNEQHVTLLHQLHYYIMVCSTEFREYFQGNNYKRTV